MAKALYKFANFQFTITPLLSLMHVFEFTLHKNDTKDPSLDISKIKNRKYRYLWLLDKEMKKRFFENGSYLELLYKNLTTFFISNT